jgi:hypothetical protein
MRSVLSDEERGARSEQQSDDRLLGARLLGRFLELQTTSLGEMYQQTRAAELEDEVLAAPTHMLDRSSLHGGCGNVERLCGGKLQRNDGL